MLIKHFTTRLSPQYLADDQQAINDFMSTVKVTKTATQFVPGSPDFWSILVFYEELKAKGQPEQPAELTEDDLDPDERQLLHALKLWRTDKAKELHIPEYMIFRNQILIEIARAKPMESKDIASIDGISTPKIFAYGEDIIAIVKAFFDPSIF